MINKIIYNFNDSFCDIKSAQDITTECVKYYLKEVDNNVSKVIIDHGYESQLNLAMYGETQKIRDDNMNILKDMVEVVFYPLKFSDHNYDMYQDYDINWKGNTI